MEIHISDRTHKFQSKTRLDAKANSELYKSKRVCSVYSQACADTKPDASGFVSAGLVLCHQTDPSLEGKMFTGT
jgi:hypothetical protein